MRLLCFLSNCAKLSCLTPKLLTCPQCQWCQGAIPLESSTKVMRLNIDNEKGVRLTIYLLVYFLNLLKILYIHKHIINAQHLSWNASFLEVPQQESEAATRCLPSNGRERSRECKVFDMRGIYGIELKLVEMGINLKKYWGGESGHHPVCQPLRQSFSTSNVKYGVTI